MDIVLFTHHESFKKGEILKNIIAEDIIDNSHEDIQVLLISTFNALKVRLKQFCDFDKQEIFILLADSKIRLNRLATLIELMEDKRIILILPDNSKTTIAEAHKFFPRFFTCMSDTYSDLREVLNKMITFNRIKVIT